MPKITPDRLKPGMKLSKPVMNKSGMVLLGENTELTDELIAKIETMDVDAVFVQRFSSPSIPLEEALLSLDNRFRGVEQEPYMDLIKMALKEHIESLYD